MAERVFDRDTLLDLTVNVIPLGILVFFIVLYTIYTPFGWESWTMGLSYALIVIPFVGLAVLTYFSARAISRDEEEATKTATEHDVGEQPRTHRQTGDTSEGTDGDGDGEGAVGIERETTPDETGQEAASDENDATTESSSDETESGNSGDENDDTSDDEEATTADS